MTMKTTLRTLALAVMLAVSAIGCSNDSPQPANSTVKAPAQAIIVKTAAVEARTVERSVAATGTLAAWDEVIVSNDAPGTMAAIKVDLGDRVRAGEVLATLDQREARLTLADAEASHLTNIKTLEKEGARVIDARTNLKRYADLYKNSMVSQSQFDSMKTQFAVAEAQYREAEARIEQSAARLSLAKKRFSDTVITAPIDGEIKKRFVSVGEVVKDKSALFSVVSTGRLKLRATVTGSSAPEIKNGQRVRITVDAFKDRVFEGSINRVSPSIDAVTRTLEVEAALENPRGELRPGFFANGEVITGEDSGVPFVPDAAVYSFVGVTKVFVIADGKAGERRVNIGAKSAGLVEITGNLKPGEIVAVSNLPVLFDGARVSVSGNLPQPLPGKEGGN